MAGFRKGATGHFTAGHGTASHGRPQCRGQGLQGRNGLGWRMPGQRGGEGSQQRQLVGLRVHSARWLCGPGVQDRRASAHGAQPATSAPGPGSPLPLLRRDRATPAYSCSRTGVTAAHICTGTWLSPPPHRHPGLGSAAAPPAAPRPCPARQMRRSVVRQRRRIAINRSLRGRSRAKLALAEALARLVRNPRDHASTSGGVVERGPLRGRSRVREGGRPRRCAMRVRVRARARAFALRRMRP